MANEFTTVQTELFNTLTECTKSQIVGADDRVIMLVCKPNQPLKNVNPIGNISDRIGGLCFDPEQGFMVFQGPANYVLIIVDRRNNFLVTAVTAAIQFNREKDH